MKLQNFNNTVSHGWTIFVILAVAFTVLTYSHDLLKIALNKDKMSDFGTYYFFSEKIERGYDISILDQNAEEKQQLANKLGIKSVHSSGYQPFFYYLLKPITWIKYPIARILWLGLIHVLLVCSLLFINKIINPKSNFITFAAIIFMATCFQPLRETVALGNSDLIILFFITLSIYFFQRDSDILSGISIALGIYIKYSFGILLLFFLWKRKFRIFFAGLVTIVLLKIMAILILGFDVQVAYLRVVKKIAIEGLYTLGVHSQTIRVLFFRLFGDKGLSNMLFTICFFIILSCTMYITRKKRDACGSSFLLEFSLWIITVFIVSPYSSLGHFVILYLPLFIIWVYIENKNCKCNWIIYVISFLLIGLKYSFAQFPQFSSGILSIVTNGHLFGVMLLYYLGIRILTSKKIYDGKENKEYIT